MPTCKKCNNNFPNQKKIDGKYVHLKSRSYCLDCSPYKEKKGYTLRKTETRCKLKGGKICPCCNKQQQKYFKNTVCSVCRNHKQRYLQRIKLKNECGGKCVRCGLKDIDILQFHHKNPDDKTFNLSSKYNSLDYMTLKIEADKCELLCPNCHAKEHSSINHYVLEYYKLNSGDRT